MSAEENKPFSKQPSEKYWVGIEYLNRLPPDLPSLVSATCAAFELPSLNDATSSVLGSTSATINGTQATVLVQGGVSETDYKISVHAFLSSGAELEDDLRMQVRER